MSKKRDLFRESFHWVWKNICRFKLKNMSEKAFFAELLEHNYNRIQIHNIKYIEVLNERIQERIKEGSDLDTAEKKKLQGLIRRSVKEIWGSEKKAKLLLKNYVRKESSIFRKYKRWKDKEILASRFDMAMLTMTRVQKKSAKEDLLGAAYSFVYKVPEETLSQVKDQKIGKTKSGIKQYIVKGCKSGRVFLNVHGKIGKYEVLGYENDPVLAKIAYTNLLNWRISGRIISGGKVLGHGW